jgi:predicted RNA-binding Zn-ribbon protein involved in translation (DUF1610 family)
MSMEHEELVKCSKCGHEDGFIIWQSLNATLNPEAKADMMESCLFEHKCPKCGHVDSYTLSFLKNSYSIFRTPDLSRSF